VRRTQTKSGFVITQVAALGLLSLNRGEIAADKKMSLQHRVLPYVVALLAAFFGTVFLFGVSGTAHALSITHDGTCASCFGSSYTLTVTKLSSGGGTTTYNTIYSVDTSGYSGGGSGLDAITYKIATEANILSTFATSQPAMFSDPLICGSLSAPPCLRQLIDPPLATSVAPPEQDLSAVNQHIADINNELVMLPPGHPRRETLINERQEWVDLETVLTDQVLLQPQPIGTTDAGRVLYEDPTTGEQFSEKSITIEDDRINGTGGTDQT